MTRDGSAAPYILIVDEEAIVGVSLADDLQEAGYRVTGPFASGAEALATVAADGLDAAVIDIDGSDGRGLEMARACRRQGVPILLFSGDDPSAVRQIGEFAGAPWVGKPALGREVLHALGKVCSAVA